MGFWSMSRRLHPCGLEKQLEVAAVKLRISSRLPIGILGSLNYCNNPESWSERTDDETVNLTSPTRFSRKEIHNSKMDIMQDKHAAK